MIGRFQVLFVLFYKHRPYIFVYLRPNTIIALCSTVEKDEKLGFVQPIGTDPQEITRELTEVYGPGAFLLAGTEIFKMAKQQNLTDIQVFMEYFGRLFSHK